jgi:tRNA G18 (ribose-2'-O)-methylase SpoU
LKQITSIQNPFIKSLALLQEKAKARKQSGTFLIEGKREIELATKGNYQLETILFLPELITENEINKLVKSKVELIEITKEVYQKLAYRDTTEGILAVAKTKTLSLNDLKLFMEIDLKFGSRLLELLDGVSGAPLSQGEMLLIASAVAKNRTSLNIYEEDGTE